jgi:hypothetical protein
VISQPHLVEDVRARSRRSGCVDTANSIGMVTFLQADAG